MWAEQQRHLETHPHGAGELHYLRKHLDFGPAIQRHLRAVDRMMPFVRGRVLEWGCRHGPDSAVLRMRIGDALELHGADIRDADLFKPFHAFSGLSYRGLDDEVALPYPDRYFDTVIAHGVLEHVANPDGSLAELHRVLAVGGTLLIDALPNRFSYTEAWNRVAGGKGHQRRFGMRDITRLLELHGFRVVAGRRVEMLPAMLTGASPRVRRAYQRGDRLIDAVNQVLERRPLSLIAASLALAARREG